MATHDDSNRDHEPCRAALDECRQRLRVARRELVKTQTWMESRSVRVDRLVGDIDVFLDGKSKSPGGGSTGSDDTCLVRLKVRRRGDGDFDVHLDDQGPFRFPPMLARLLTLLAEDKGRDAADGLVGFKSKGHLLTALAASTDIHNGNFALGRPAKLRQAIYALRTRLGRFVSGGEHLVQTRRNVGFRLAMRRPDRR